MSLPKTMESQPHSFRIDELLEHRSWATRLARSLLRDPSAADDVVQQTWIAALRRPPKRGRPVRGWLAGVIRNEARQHHRGEGRRKQRETRVAASKGHLPPAHEIAAKVEMQRLLAQAVLELDEPYATAVMLRYFEGLSAAEIARKRGVPAATVRSWLQRGLDKLRVALDRRHGGDRRSWQLALVPLLSRRGAFAGLFGSVVAGVLLMKTTTKIAVCLCALLLAGVYYVVSHDARGIESTESAAGSDPAPLEGVADPASSDAPHLEGREARTAPREAPAPAAPSATETSDVVKLSGHCVDRDGNVLAGARIVAGVAAGTGTGTQVVTGEDGSFQVNIRPWPDITRVVLTVTADGYENLEQGVSAHAGQEVNVGEIVLAPGGAVSGLVLGPNGRPVMSATVLATKPGLSANARRNARLLGPWKQAFPFRVRTDEDGRYTLTGMPVGTLRLWANADGHEHTFSEPLEVLAGRTTRAPTLRLAPLNNAELITGVVHDEEGQPDPNAMVIYRWASDDGSGTSGKSVDEGGRFLIPVRDAARYWLRAESFDGAHRTREHGPVSGGAKLVLAYKAEAQVELRVLGADGKPVERFQALVLDPEGNRSRTPEYLTSPSGVIGKVALPDHDFMLEVSARGHVSKRVGPFARTRSEPIGVTLEARDGIRGVVRHADAPLADVVVTLHSFVAANAEVMENGFPVRTNGQPDDTTRTDASGRFTLFPTHAGRYVVRVEAGGAAPTESDPIDVRGLGVSEPITLEVTTGGALKGTVRGTRDRSAAGIVVGISRADGHARSTRTDVEGNYRFTRLMPGKYEVRILERDLADGYHTMSSREIETPVEFPWKVEVFEGKTASYDIDLAASEGVQLEGSLMIDGAPAEGWTAELFSLTPDSGLVPGEKDAIETDEDGRFRLAKDAAGSYLLRVSTQDEKAPNVLARLELGLGVTPWSLSFETGRLEGTFGDAERLQPGERLLHVWEAGQGAFVVTAALPDGAGRFTFEDVPVGPGRLVRLTVEHMKTLGVDGFLRPDTWPTWKTVEVERGE